MADSRAFERPERPSFYDGLPRALVYAAEMVAWGMIEAAKINQGTAAEPPVPDDQVPPDE